MKKIVTIIAVALVLLLAVTTIPVRACNLPHFNTRSGTTPWVLRNGRPHFSSTTCSARKYRLVCATQTDFDRYKPLCLTGDNMWDDSLFLYSSSNYVGEIVTGDDVTSVLSCSITVNSNNHVTDWVMSIDRAYASMYYTNETGGNPPTQKLSNLFATGFGYVAGLGYRSNLNCAMKDVYAMYSVTAGDKKGMRVVTHNHEHSDVDALRGTYTYDTSSRHEVVCSVCLAYTYQSHFTGHCTYKDVNVHNKVCVCNYVFGTEPHSYSYSYGNYYCIGCGHITSNPGGIQ